MEPAAALARIEAYYDAVPRSAARVEEHGPLTLFVSERAGWHYYARPRLGGSGPIRPADVERVRARQRQLRLPEALEWVTEVTPTLRAAAEASGLRVHEHPLMVLDRSAFAAGGPDRADVRMLGWDDPELAACRAVANVGFASPGTAVGEAGAEALAAAAAAVGPDALAALRDRLRSGLTRMAAGFGADGPLSVGSHQPVGPVTEVVGVATLPAARRRGLAAAVTRALVADALASGCEVVFLSAGDDAVARIYARLGFRPVATALIAEAPAPAGL
jgi:ribosomal protein S18 acetylase RimI-like enzyme